jgi:predicted transcriptional regulator
VTPPLFYLQGGKVMAQLAKERVAKYRERHEVERSIDKYTGVEGKDYVVCQICGKRGLYIDERHLKTRHNITKEVYIEKFPNALLSSEKKNEAQSRPNNDGNLGRKFSKEHREKISLSRTNGVPWTERELEEYADYKAKVRFFTNQNFHKYYWQINPDNLKRGEDYHLDHIFPVVEGYKNNIPPEVIADPSNLQMLTSEENLSKGCRI